MPFKQVFYVQASILRSSEYVYIPNEERARLFDFCVGCFGHKESGKGKPIVCWHCWHNEILPFKFWNGTLEKWVEEFKLLNNK